MDLVSCVWKANIIMVTMVVVPKIVDQTFESVISTNVWRQLMVCLLLTNGIGKKLGHNLKSLETLEKNE